MLTPRGEELSAGSLRRRRRLSRSSVANSAPGASEASGPSAGVGLVEFAHGPQ